MPSSLSSLLNLPDQLSFVGGTALVLVGVFLRIRLPHLAMEAEEYVKDRRLTEDEARRRIRVLNLAVPVVIVAGLGACVLAVLT